MPATSSSRRSPPASAGASHLPGSCFPARRCGSSTSPTRISIATAPYSRPPSSAGTWTPAVRRSLPRTSPPRFRVTVPATSSSPYEPHDDPVRGAPRLPAGPAARATALGPGGAAARLFRDGRDPVSAGAQPGTLGTSPYRKRRAVGRGAARIASRARAAVPFRPRRWHAGADAAVGSTAVRPRAREGLRALDRLRVAARPVFALRRRRDWRAARLPRHRHGLARARYRYSQRNRGDRVGTDAGAPAGQPAAGSARAAARNAGTDLRRTRYRPVDPGRQRPRAPAATRRDAGPGSHVGPTRNRRGAADQRGVTR